MKGKEYFRQLGTTSGCVRRAVDAAVKFETVPPEEKEEDDASDCNGDSKREQDLWEFDDIDDYIEYQRRNKEDTSQVQTVSNYVCIYYKTQLSNTLTVFFFNTYTDNKPV